MAPHLSNLHPDVQEFVECLQRIHSLLAADDEQFWRLHIQKVIQIAKNSDGYSVELFLSGFGGMGSFSDLGLNGSVTADSAFRKERAKAYEIAQKLR